MDHGPLANPPTKYPDQPDQLDQQKQQQQQQERADQQQLQLHQPQQKAIISTSFPPPQERADQQQLQLHQPQQKAITSTVSFPPPPASTFTHDPRLPERAVVVNGNGNGGSSSSSSSTPFFAGTDIRTIKAACEISLGDCLVLQRRRYEYNDPKAQDRLRVQYGIVVSDLRTLRDEVAVLVKEAESQRWRRWFLGGLVASFIPIVRKIFRRPADDKESTTDTEHAFKRSRSLVSRILETVRRGGGRLASIASIVLAVLYIFQNEVALRVAKTVSRRLKRLTNKIERGEGDVVEKDLDILKGWRWRVLLMS